MEMPSQGEIDAAFEADICPSHRMGLSGNLLPGCRYDVATNLNNNSISFRSTSMKSGSKSGKVVDYEKQVHLINCEFRVLASGLKRLREDGVKNVHAFVRGDLVSVSAELKDRDYFDWSLVRYLPFENDYFFLHDTGEKIVHCNEAVLIGRTLYIR